MDSFLSSFMITLLQQYCNSHESCPAKAELSVASNIANPRPARGNGVHGGPRDRRVRGHSV